MKRLTGTYGIQHGYTGPRDGYTVAGTKHDKVRLENMLLRACDLSYIWNLSYNISDFG